MFATSGHVIDADTFTLYAEARSRHIAIAAMPAAEMRTGVRCHAE